MNLPQFAFLQRILLPLVFAFKADEGSRLALKGVEPKRFSAARSQLCTEPSCPELVARAPGRPQWSKALGTSVRTHSPSSCCTAGWLSRRRWLLRTPQTTSPAFLSRDSCQRPKMLPSAVRAQPGLCVSGSAVAPNWQCKQWASVFVPRRQQRSEQ